MKGPGVSPHPAAAPEARRRRGPRPEDARGGRVGRTLRRALAAAAAAVASMAAAPGGASSQQQAVPADTTPSPDSVPSAAVSVDSAAEIRAGLRRPPGSPPFDALDAVALPFRVATYPLHLLVEAAGEVAALAAGPGPQAFYLRAYEDVVDWGLEPGVGSVGPRSGPALSLELVRWSPAFLSTAFSVRGSQRHRAGLRLGGDGPVAPALTASFGFRRLAEPHFWGLGPGTPTTAAADYLHDRWSADLSGRWAPASSMRLEVHGGWEENSVARGFDGSEPDLQDRFDPASLFGAGERTEFLRAGVGARIDLAPRVGFRRRGVELEAGAARYFGVGGTRADFHRLRARAAGFVPVGHGQTLALHGGLETNDPDGGRGVPFTHMATLGDGPGGRAYDDQRFRARDMAYVGGEWRFMAWRELRDRAQLKGFLFFEEGVVASGLGDVSSSDWRPSWGGGLRFEDRDGLVLEAFVADGEEGARFQVDTGVSF